MPTFRTFILAVTALTALSCSCTRRGAAGGLPPEFYSGVYAVTDTGGATFTDCATRVTLPLAGGERYEKLRQRYQASTAADGRLARIEFYGAVETTDSNVSMVSIDSLLMFSVDEGCLDNYAAAGFYRKVDHGQAEILRLRPDYGYSIETFTNDGTFSVLDSGRWYRTSETILELLSHADGLTRAFQIVPAQESLAATDGPEPVVYKKEWL